MEDPENTFLITHPNSNIVNRNFCGHHYKKVIFDGFLDVLLTCKDKCDEDKFFHWFNTDLLPCLEDNGELVLISTPDKLRNSSSYLLFSLGLVSKNKIKNDFVNKETIMKEIEDFDKWLLCPNDHLQVIKTDFNIKRDEDWKKEQKRLLSNERYLIDIEGEFLK